MTISRRQVLNYMRTAGAIGLTNGALAGALTGFQAANAANVSGYKALVCVFLLGGMDSHDTLLPYDQDSYDRLADIRSTIFSAHNGRRSRARLLPLTPSNASDFGSRQFALSEDLAGIHNIVQGGNGAIVGNVGPLLRPITRETYDADASSRPSKLFSHNDQQSTWIANAPEGAQFGWGGRFLDAALRQNANTQDAFSAIALKGGQTAFLTGEIARPYQISSRGPDDYDELSRRENRRERGDEEEAVYQLLREHLASSRYQGENFMRRDVANILGTSLANNETFIAALAAQADPPIDMPDTDLGRQLRTTLQTIQAGISDGNRRQVFYVAMGGYDTHSNQAGRLSALHQDLDASISSFYQNLAALNLAQDVTLFTASDFGRTLTDNGGGTDHAWAGHHFVIGNSVRGNQIYGQIPPHDFDHEFDVGRGRFLPTTSIEQYATDLGRWFGLDDDELNAALPNRAAFDTEPDLGFML